MGWCDPERVKSSPVELIFTTDSDIKIWIFFGPVLIAETTSGLIQSAAVALNPTSTTSCADAKAGAAPFNLASWNWPMCAAFDKGMLWV